MITKLSSVNSGLSNVAGSNAWTAGSADISTNTLLYLIFTIFTFLFMAAMVIGLTLEMIGNPYLYFKLKKGNPVIGYKYANTHYSGRFSGVSGGYSYNVIDSTKGRGFHTFNSLDTLKSSGYKGQVILEVLLYGKVHKHDDGFIASDQRVLQVLPSDTQKCQLCDKDNPESVVKIKGTNDRPYSAVICGKCGKKPSFLKGIIGYEDYSKDSVNLQEWINKNREICGSEYPVNVVHNMEDFVPTVIPEKESKKDKAKTKL